MTVLQLLRLSGCLTLATGLLHQYHFVDQRMTWYDAQSFCRNNYVDLATVEDAAEMTHLADAVVAAGYGSQVWIGLFVELFGTWALNLTTQPGPAALQGGWCGSMSSDGANWYENCSAGHPFICDNGTQQVLVNQTVDYLMAWSYCRKHLTDITSMYSSSYAVWHANAQALVPSGARAWVGLVAFDFFFWSDASSSVFRYLDQMPQIFDSMGVMHAVADLQRSGKWSLVPQGTRPFVCYTKDTEVKQTSKTVLQLRISTSADVGDAAVEADILAQLQIRLTEGGGHRATLQWRTQAKQQQQQKTDVSQHQC